MFDSNSLPDAKFLTDGILISQNGQTLFEKYDRGYQPETSHIAWSISKSVSNLVFAAAVQKGLIQTNVSICDLLTSLQSSSPLCGLQPQHFLSWTTGLQWQETYEHGSSRTKSSVGQMLYGDGHENMAKFVLDHSLVHPVGSSYHYSTGDAVVLMALLKAGLSKDRYDNLPWELLFDPLGLEHVTFEQDREGTFLGGSGLYLPPRALARIGELILQNGVWKGHQILPPHWVAETSSYNPHLNGEVAEPEFLPALSWWRLRVPESGSDSDLPKDAILARGHWGQLLIVVPSLRLVVVRTAEDKEQTIDTFEFLHRILDDLKAAP